MHTIKEEVWADAEGNAVPYGDERGRTVLFGAGRQISDEDATKYGLTKTAAKPDASPDSDKPGEDNADEANQPGLGERVAAALAAAGFDTPEKIAAASDDDLRAVPGIGPATLAKIRAV
jgi:DNA uptake protein ComE-like DNA-binding protein